MSETAMSQRYRVEYQDGRWGSCWALIDTATGAEIGDDSGEPEDMLLVRRLSWVPEAMNELAVALDHAQTIAVGASWDAEWAREALAEEREACAQLVEAAAYECARYCNHQSCGYGEHAAADIRARGEGAGL